MYPDSGAYHGSEIPIIFNTPASGEGIMTDTVPERELMNYTRGAWAAFAKNPVNGLETYQGGWPAYNPTENTLVRLGYGGSVGTDLAPPAMYDAPCGTAFAVNSTSINQMVTGTATNPTAKTSMGNVIPTWKGSATIFSVTITTLKLLL
jgi:hypothetical protein